MSDLQTREQMLSELSHHNVIPEDAMKAAREAAAEAYPDARLSILAAMVDELYMVPIIARAILAERERSRTALSETEQRARREALEEAAKLVEQKLGGLMLDSFIFNDVRAKNEEGSTLFLSLERAQKVVEDRASAIRALISSEPHDAEGRETPRRGDPSIFDDAEGRN